ncbi:MAG: hypothetical protein ACLS48_10490 [[Eubacterium] siraeum]
MKCGLYTEHLKENEQARYSQPVPCGYHQSYDEIKSLVKALLADENKAMRSMTSALTKNQYASIPTLR